MTYTLSTDWSGGIPGALSISVLGPLLALAIATNGSAASCGVDPAAPHLLVTEIKLGPTSGEFVEIHNPTAMPIDLSDYYLYSATTAGPPELRYYNIVFGAAGGDGCCGDFSLRFPAGALIPAGAYQVIAVTGSLNYCATYGCPDRADYEIPPPAADDVNVPNMRGVWDLSSDVFTTFGFLSTAGEEIVLFHWDGVVPHVDDVDYVIWGSGMDYRTSKTGVLDYVADTPIGEQQPITGSPTVALSFQRQCLNEGAETKTGGNGIGGHDETSEDLGETWVVAEPTPGAHTVVGIGDSPHPALTAVLQNRPNPVHVGGAGTTVTFTLAEAARATVKLFDVQGREVVTLVDGGFAPGAHHCHWGGRLADGTSAAAGIYLCRLETRGQSFTRRLVVLR